ncbi:clathrin heavy chain linker domain-containing protein 1-like isoform X2 [Anguilla anguilla]|nr:clathrin heavy chain linker domain-containing protein 1-like isoform X2 [Anguilla anguilla]
MAGFQTRKATSSKSPFIGTRALPPINSTSDRKFFDSLQKYIQDQKKCLNRPSEGPDLQRYNVYSSAFDKVIERTTACKMVLSAIKKDYDDAISAVKRSEYEDRRTQRRLRGKAGEPTALMYYKMRAAQLQERIAIIEENTAQLHAELRRLQERRRERRPSQRNASDSKDLPATAAIPGLTLQQSVNLETLQTYLEKLERKLADLQRKKHSQYVSNEVMADLESKMRCALDHRDELAAENLTLELRHRKMVFLYEAFSSWENSERAVPLSEFLPSILEKISHFKVRDADYHDVITRVSEEDDPSEDEESKLLSDYVERFTQLFEGGEYQAAALHAARAPRGILRNMETMDRFKAVGRYEGALPPALLYFQALMMAVPAGQRLPGEGLAVEGVRSALQNGCLEQAVHWVTQHRLTFSEALGDVLNAHAQEDAVAADSCLALAQVVYGACELHSKAAVCMSRRGFIHRAVEFIYSNKAFTKDDCLYVVRSCPSVALLQALTQELQGRPAVLSLGWAARSLMDTQSEELVYQLLESMQGCGALEQAVRGDRAYTAEGWSQIAGRCRETGRPQLAQAVSSALASLRGATRLPPGIERTRPTGRGFRQDAGL